MGSAVPGQSCACSLLCKTACEIPRRDNGGTHLHPKPGCARPAAAGSNHDVLGKEIIQLAKCSIAACADPATESALVHNRRKPTFGSTVARTHRQPDARRSEGLSRPGGFFVSTHCRGSAHRYNPPQRRSEEHTSELQSRGL